MADNYSQIEKSISFFINQQFPGIYREDGPELVQLARDYYKWMETSSNQSVYVSRRFFEYRDIDTTIKSLLIFYKNKYLADLELKESIVPFLVKNILDLYRRKGTRAGIELFFATFYKEYDIEVAYPSTKMLKPSNSEWKTGNFLQIIPNDNLFTSANGIQYTYADLISRVITGTISQAQASVTKINSILINGRYTPIIYIDNVKGTFVRHDVIYTNINSEVVEFGSVNGSLSKFTVDTALEPDRQVGELVQIISDTNTGLGGEGVVTKVSGLVDARARYTIDSGGYGYTVANTSLLVSEQSIITDPSNTVKFEPYERLRDTNGNEAYVIGQNATNIGVKFTNKVDTNGFEHVRAISTLDRSPNIDLKFLGIQQNVSSFNDSSPGILYPEGNPQNANTQVIAELSNVETVELITDLIQPHLTTQLNAADYEATAPMSGTASPVTLATPLDEAFDISGIEIGKISLFENIDPGNLYDFDIFARAKDDLVSKFQKRSQTLRLANAGEAALFNVGEIITEASTGITAEVTSIDIVNDVLYILPNSWNGLTGLNNILRTNNDSFNVAGVSTDYSSRAYGDNAVIDARAQFELGYIEEVAINNSGFAYLSQAGFNSATLYSLSDTSQTLPLATGTIEAEEAGKNKGYWKDFSSHINGYVTDPANNAVIDSYYNSGMRIQDSDFYQEYSYQIKSTLDKSQYEKLLKENVHLAGSKMFGDFIYKYDNTGTTKARFLRLFNDNGSGSPLDIANTSTLEASVTNFTVDSTYVTADHEPV